MRAIFHERFDDCARATGDPKLFVVLHRRAGESLADPARLDARRR